MNLSPDWKIDECVEEIIKFSKKCGSVKGSQLNAFEDGYKLFSELPRNLYSDESKELFQQKLKENGIDSTIVYNGMGWASSLQPCVLFWKLN